MNKIIKILITLTMIFNVLISCKEEITLGEQLEKFTDKKDYEGAIVELNKMLVHDSSNPEIFYYLGYYYLILDKYQLALENYDIFLDKNEDSSHWMKETTFFDRGVVKYELGDYLGSIIDLDISINLAPEDPYIHFVRAKTLMKLELYEEACDDMDFYRDETILGVDPKYNIELDKDFNFMYETCDCERINKLSTLRLYNHYSKYN